MSSQKSKGTTNPVIEAIRKRMSIRSYKPDPIPRDIIDTVIEAGNLAPSRAREGEDGKEFVFQPWRFVVVEDREFRLKLLQAAFPFWKRMMEGMKDAHPGMYEQVMTQYEAMDEPKDMIYYSAPVILFVIGPVGFDISCALACENIMIAATALGLGSCYVGFGSMVTDDAEVVKALELADGEKIYGPIVLGYPMGEPDKLASFRAKKKDPMVKWI